jgi:hypothetical protein
MPREPRARRQKRRTPSRRVTSDVGDDRRATSPPGTRKGPDVEVQPSPPEPRSVSEGLAESFRSHQTPPFAMMLSQLFGAISVGPTNKGPEHSGRCTRPRVGFLAPRRARRKPGRERIANRWQQDFTGGGGADTCPFDRGLGRGGGKEGPSIVDRVSKFYAEQPALLKTPGGLALTVAMEKVAQRQTQTRR